MMIDKTGPQRISKLRNFVSVQIRPPTATHFLVPSWHRAANNGGKRLGTLLGYSADCAPCGGMVTGSCDRGVTWTRQRRQHRRGPRRFRRRRDRRAASADDTRLGAAGRRRWRSWWRRRGGAASLAADERAGALRVLGVGAAYSFFISLPAPSLDRACNHMPPPPCPSRTHGPSDLRWRLPTPPSRTPYSGTLRRRGSA